MKKALLILALIASISGYSYGMATMFAGTHNHVRAYAEQTVYISTGGSGRCYHSTSKCRGLFNAKGIKALSTTEAQEMGKRPCQLCWH